MPVMFIWTLKLVTPTMFEDAGQVRVASMISRLEGGALLVPCYGYWPVSSRDSSYLVSSSEFSERPVLVFLT